MTVTLNDSEGALCLQVEGYHLELMQYPSNPRESQKHLLTTAQIIQAQSIHNHTANI